MRILVTGGAGFIGSHLSERLLEAGHAVSILDDLDDFYPPAWKRANLEEIRRAGRFVFHQCDICDLPRVASILQTDSPEVLIHLAARAGVRPSLEQPLLYERVNVGGTLTLLEAARRVGIRKLIFASSSSVYGNSNRVPFREDDPAHLPVSPYAATKIAGENLCYTYSHLYRMPVVCLRLFTVYGPRQRPDLAIRKFAERIDHNRPVPVFGDGSSARDYTFVDDIVSGILAAISFECAFEIFNLGNSHPVNLGMLIDSIETTLRKRARREYLPEQPGDVRVTCADITKAQGLLGYRPATPFLEGIRKFVHWYLERKEAAVGVA